MRARGLKFHEFFFEDRDEADRMGTLLIRLFDKDEFCAFKVRGKPSRWKFQLWATDDEVSLIMALITEEITNRLDHDYAELCGEDLADIPSS